MRLTAIVTAMVLSPLALAWAQTPTPVQHPYGLDPYKPSDAELLRKYGSVLATQTPLLELRKLDPYKPSHAALLRALGGAMPLWTIWYPFGSSAKSNSVRLATYSRCRLVADTIITRRARNGARPPH